MCSFRYLVLIWCKKVTQKIKSIAPENIDNRKKKLFELIYSSNGSITVKELSEKVYWSSRQINRYFNQQFGISLKAYCNILRFGASFKHISEGKLFPEQNFTDQNHFIKEIKKYAGVTPKELSKNKDDRFIDITAIKKFPSWKRLIFTISSLAISTILHRNWTMQNHVTKE